jgi:hypothetical protein
MFRPNYRAIFSFCLGYFVLCVFGCCGCIRDFYFGVIRGELFCMTCPVNVNVRITIVQFPLQVFVFMDATLTIIYNFQVRLSHCVEYKLQYNINIYNTYTTLYFIRLY